MVLELQLSDGRAAALRPAAGRRHGQLEARVRALHRRALAHGIDVLPRPVLVLLAAEEQLAALVVDAEGEWRVPAAVVADRDPPRARQGQPVRRGDPADEGERES